MVTERGTVDFQAVLQSEHDSINRRRHQLKREPVKEFALNPDKGPPIYDTVGLSLSGGGIRSAAISLGALQALNQCGVLTNIDYLSTVSGGGYIGSSLTATMTATGGRFVFANERSSGAGAGDSPALGHLRNHSNYLLSGGKHNFGSAVAIIVRGLVSNLAIVLPFLLLFSAWIILAYSTPYKLPSMLTWASSSFPITISLMILGTALFLLWALYFSSFLARNLTDESSRLPALGAIYLVVVGVIFFIELQPLVVKSLVDFKPDSNTFTVGRTVYTALIWPAPGLDDTQLGESSLPLELHRAQIPDRRVPSL
jgi:patatin-like phospholipase